MQKSLKVLYGQGKAFLFRVTTFHIIRLRAILMKGWNRRQVHQRWLPKPSCSVECIGMPLLQTPPLTRNAQTCSNRRAWEGGKEEGEWIRWDRGTSLPSFYFCINHINISILIFQHVARNHIPHEISSVSVASKGFHFSKSYCSHICVYFDNSGRSGIFY